MAVYAQLTPAGGLSDFGAIVLGSIFLIGLIITVLGIRRAIQSTEGTALPVWILLIIIFAPVGGIIALLALKPRIER